MAREGSARAEWARHVLLGVLSTSAAACASLVMPGDGSLTDAADGSLRTDAIDARVDVIGIDAVDVPEEPIQCVPEASVCHLGVNFCDQDQTASNVCSAIAQCDTDDSGATALGYCTHGGPSLCAQADHCDDDAAIPAYGTCHCGNGPPCPSGAVCVTSSQRPAPHCECIHGT